ncbi:hypothetical protein E5167_05460 [Pontimicrobium aquaticum]|uniref:RHS repeat-associated core domain-containing protein n=1 Tax=Pontimicrobium aquaticum TaxID=2565367 RepID=A0A4U0EZ54_9FLAO|nr:hypothetical protein E5167_05460 [Pontimicrobium aquaticum]
MTRKKNYNNGSSNMDDLTYDYYTSKPNQLKRIIDGAGDAANADDITTHSFTDNYVYNGIGQLIENKHDQLKYYYNASGLVTEIKKNNVSLVKFFYNDRGHRVKKEIYTSGSLTRSDYYVRDAAGSVLAVYENSTLKENTIYGASRLGVHYRSGGTNAYQLTDHLGNVRAVVVKNGSSALTVTNKTDYYPFGMPMPNRNVEGGYRYKFQGQEKDPETGKEAFELRLWDSRIGRWQRPDPMRQYHSPYLGMGNIPSSAFDGDGSYVYIMGSNGELLRVYNKVMGTEIGASAIDYFINNPDKHVIISAASTKGAGGVTTYVGNYSKKTTWSSSKANFKMNGWDKADKIKYNNHMKSFVGTQLQPGDNYLISIDTQNNSPHFNLEAAFHEIYAHAYAKEALGIKNTRSNPDAQHFYIGGSENGRFDNMPTNGPLGPPFTQYPIQEFYDSDMMFLEQGGVSIGNFIPNLGRINSLIFGTQNAGNAKKVEIIVGPLVQGAYEN